MDRAALAEKLPHAGAMVLLDGVSRWDATSIDCVADSHRDPSNPLRRDGRLGILCGVEYAAQAMALHGALSGGGAEPRGGMLANLRDLVWHAPRLDLLPGQLLIRAERLHGEANRVIYSFALRHADLVLLEGRAAVVLT